MTRLKRFWIKNAMLISNGVANLVGIIVVAYLMSGQRHELSGEVFRASLRMDLIFIPLSYALAILLTLLYERPIRRFVNLKILDGPLPEGLEAKARKRLLNEPFYLIGSGYGHLAVCGHPLSAGLLDY